MDETNDTTAEDQGPKRLTPSIRALCAIGAILCTWAGIVEGVINDPPASWHWRAPMLLLLVVGYGLAYLAIPGKRSTLIEALIESAWFPA